MTQGKRVPRIAGLTLKVTQLRKLEGDQQVTQYNALRDWVIYNWFLSKGNLCGTNYTQGELALYLNCSVEDIQVYMRDQVMKSKVWDKDVQEELVQGLLGQQLSWVLEDRMMVESQVKLLLDSQDGKYKPFISDAVLKSMKLQLESTTSIQSLIRNLSGGSNVNIFNQFNQQNNNNVGVTYDEVLEIVQGASDIARVTDNSETLSYIESSHSLLGLPVVNAREQDPTFLQKEGITQGGAELKRIAEFNSSEIANVELIEIENDRKEHEIRRQREYGELEEDLDPEISHY